MLKCLSAVVNHSILYVILFLNAPRKPQVQLTTWLVNYPTNYVTTQLSPVVN
jgi:hypothetical protein